MKQIIPCTENLYAVYSDSEIGEFRLKVLFLGIDDYGSVEPLVFDAEFGIGSAYFDGLLRFELDCVDWLREDNADLRRLREDNADLRRLNELLKKKCELLKQKDEGKEHDPDYD